MILRTESIGDSPGIALGLAQDAAGDRRARRPVGHQLLEPHQKARGAGRDQALHGRSRSGQAGYSDFAIVQLTLESHTDETLYEFGRVLATIPEIQEAYLVSGDYDWRPTRPLVGYNGSITAISRAHGTTRSISARNTSRRVRFFSIAYSALAKLRWLMIGILRFAMTSGTHKLCPRHPY
jgi:hypothetical protein